MKRNFNTLLHNEGVRDSLLVIAVMAIIAAIALLT
jgi:hypothetical protein